MPSYLGFHLRRVDATVDPNVRGTVEAASNEHRTATVAWVELVGPDVDVHKAKSLEAEVQAYHTALRNLGGAADEIEQLRTELAERAEPAVAATRDGPRPGLRRRTASPPTTSPTRRPSTRRVAAAIQRGRRARIQGELEMAEAREQDAARQLSAQLLQLGFDSGELDARLGALEWAVARAREREEARANARPSAVIEAELVDPPGDGPPAASAPSGRRSARPRPTRPTSASSRSGARSCSCASRRSSPRSTSSASPTARPPSSAG